MFSHPFSQGGYLLLYNVSKISHPISHGISHNFYFHIYFHRVVYLPCDRRFTCPFTWCFTSYTVKYAVKKRSPFHMVFTCLFHMNFHISVKFCGKNCVKPMWTSCEEFTWFSHLFHIVFTLNDWHESSHCCCHTITRSHLWGFSVIGNVYLTLFALKSPKIP